MTFKKATIICLAVWLALCSPALAGNALIQADGGIAAFLGPGNAAEAANGLGAGMCYRPTYPDSNGVEQISRVMFCIGISQATSTYGQVGLVYRFARAWGIEWMAGPYAMALDESGAYSLGPLIEVRAEFKSGNNPMDFKTAVGYVFRSATEENPDPNCIAFYAKIGVRTQ